MPNRLQRARARQKERGTEEEATQIYPTQMAKQEDALGASELKAWKILSEFPHQCVQMASQARAEEA
jgi:hypothetical protein